MPDLPALPGSYALHLALAEPARLEIGRLGIFDFPSGSYLYLGSAHGPGGLRGRLNHHARIAINPHWHIDYLRAVARLEGAWYATDPARLECAWSQALRQLPGAIIPVRGFGARDCTQGCAAHLVLFPGGLDRGAVEAVLLAGRSKACLAQSCQKSNSCVVGCDSAILYHPPGLEKNPGVADEDL